MTRTSTDAVKFYDYHPEAACFYDEVVDGLNKQPRVIPPKFFYDEKGSQLFDSICATPEYYPTRTEIQILENNIEEISKLIGTSCLLVEPGSGNSRKVRILLDKIRPKAYMPMDISRDFLLTAAEDVAGDYPWLEVHAACVDYTNVIHLPFCPAELRRVAFFPGSSIGNFEPHDAIAFLNNIAKLVAPNGALLIGVDLKKDPDILHAAYNDKQNITAAFNLNLLSRINRELKADFDLSKFSHHAFYNETNSRVEMHLISDAPQQVHVNGKRFEFSAGESIHTENSYKYTVEEFQNLAAEAGFTPVRVWTDPAKLFSVHYCKI